LLLVVAAHAGVSSRQLVEKGLGLLQVPGVEALGEPVVDGCEKLAGLLLAALPLPEAGEARRRTKLPEFGALPARDPERIAEGRFCLCLFAGCKSEKQSDGGSLQAKRRAPKPVT
jgi:hypothetical protein